MQFVKQVQAFTIPEHVWGKLTGQPHFKLQFKSKKSRMQETLKHLTCSDSSKDAKRTETDRKGTKKKKKKSCVRCHVSCVKCHKSNVMCHMSCIMCHMLCVACRLSPFTFHLPLIPIALAPPSANSPNMQTSINVGLYKWLPK